MAQTLTSRAALDEGDACRIARAEDGFVFLDHPSGRTVRIRPGDSWVRYRFGIYETARIRIRAGDRVRWTRNDKRHDLLNGGEAVVLGIDSRRVRFDLGGGKPLSLARDDPQLRHIDHAWSTTVQAAQGMTRDRAIGVLDTGHGRLTGQAGLYVEASRARDRFVLVTDNRETLEEALEENDGARLTAREAVGETDLPARPADAAIRMLRDLRDDWRALVARAEAENTELNRMEGYARIVTGVQALAAGLDLPPEMQTFVDEVRQRDARIVEGRRDELAFVQKAEAHCHRHPLLKWAAEERGVAVSELPEHAAWLAEGAALEESGRRMQETPGFVGRIAAALGRIAQGFRLDEGERFREAAARHEADARSLGIDPGGMAGAARLVQRAEALGRHELPEAVRRTVEAWAPEPESPAPEGNAVERLRAEGRQQLAVEHGADALLGGRLVAAEMGFLPRTLDEVPEQRSDASGRAGCFRFRFRLARMAFPADLRDGLQRHRTKRDPPRPPASVLQQDIAPPAGGPDPNPKADKMIIPNRVFPLAGAETGDGAVGEPHAFPAGHDSGLQRSADGLGGVHHRLVGKVGVFERGFRTAVTEQLGDGQHGLALPQSDAGMGVAEVVQANAAQPGFGTNRVPEPFEPALVPRPFAARRREHPRSGPVQPIENVPGRPRQPDGAGPCLGVAEEEMPLAVVVPAERQDLALAAPRQQEEADHGDLLRGSLCMCRQSCRQVAYLLVRQKARAPLAAVASDAQAGVGALGPKTHGFRLPHDDGEHRH